MDEKRKTARLKQNMPVRQKAEDSSHVESTTTQDISSGGLRISTDSQINIGTKLNIEVNIAGASNPYYAVGEVVWLKEKEQTDDKKFDMGIRFVRIVTKEDLEDF